MKATEIGIVVANVFKRRLVHKMSATEIGTVAVFLTVAAIGVIGYTTLSRIEGNIAALEKKIGDMPRELKALDYLKAARSKDIDDVARGLLYRLAIQNSDDKAVLLSEYAGVEDAAIQQLIKQKKLPEAEARASQLIRYFDTSIEQGSVADILSIGDLKASLGNISKRLDEERTKEKQSIEKAITEIELSIASTTNYEGCVALLKKLEAVDAVGLADALKDPVRKVLTNKIACMTPVTESILLPEIDEETPWIMWLENFKHRLEDRTLSYSAKIKDITICADFLSQAHNIEDVSVSNLLAEIDVVVACENRKDWQVRAIEIISGGIEKRSKKEAMRCVELLEEVGEFAEDNRVACSNEIVSLNKIVVSSALSEVYKQAFYVRELKGKIPQDEYVQLVSSLEGQCLQSLVRLQLLNSEFDGKFNDMIASVCAAVDGYSSIMSGVRKSKESAQDTVSRDREKKFVEWAKYMIDIAERTYNEGEKKAKEWLATTSNDYAQGRYKEAWKLIVRIKSGDLAASDELLYHRWQEVKAKIENRYKPTEADFKNGEYRGLSDF